MRFAVTARKNGHEVKVFLMGKLLKLRAFTTKKFDVAAQVEAFHEAGGEILACGTCLKSRNMDGSEVCPLSTMIDCLKMVEWADKTVTF